MKRLLIIIMVSALLIASFAGCGDKARSTNADNSPSPSAAASNGTTGNSNDQADTSNWKGVLYFSDNQGMNIHKQERQMTVDGEASITDKAKKSIEELIKGSNDDALNTCIPKNTKVLSVVQENDTLIVDLSEEFLNDHVGGHTGVIMSIGPMVLSLTEFEGITQVSFKIGGKVLSEFKGEIEFNRPFKRTEFEQYITK